jgi:hypothetical protein
MYLAADFIFISGGCGNDDNDDAASLAHHVAQYERKLRIESDLLAEKERLQKESRKAEEEAAKRRESVNRREAEYLAEKKAKQAENDRSRNRDSCTFL